MNFRLIYFTLGSDNAPYILNERNVEAQDAERAVSQVRGFEWPDKSISWRLVDVEGSEIASHVKVDERSESGLPDASP